MRMMAITKLGIIALLVASPARAQEGTYDLWLCLEECDESSREALAYTVADLVLSAAPISLDSTLRLTDLSTQTAVNGCIITHVEAGRVFRPESDVFSLLEWSLTGDSEVTIDAPQEPFPYSVVLTMSDEIKGRGSSGDQTIFVSGAARVSGDEIHCEELVELVQDQ